MSYLPLSDIISLSLTFEIENNTFLADSLLSGAMGRALLFIRRFIGSSKAASNTARMLVVKVAGKFILSLLITFNLF